MRWEDVTPEGVTPSNAVESASWIAGLLHPWAQNDVGTVLPTGFAAYARLANTARQEALVPDGLPELLAKHTSTPDSCWFCIWDGFGYGPGASAWLEEAPGSGPEPRPRPMPLWRRFSFRVRPTKVTPVLPDRTRVRLPNRDYLLYTGPVGRAVGWLDGPNLWWPEDRAWCVAAEIDLDDTYLGGSTELIDQAVRLLGARYTTVDDQNRLSG